MQSAELNKTKTRIVISSAVSSSIVSLVGLHVTYIVPESTPSSAYVNTSAPNGTTGFVTKPIAAGTPKATRAIVALVERQIKVPTIEFLATLRALYHNTPPCPLNANRGVILHCIAIH